MVSINDIRDLKTIEFIKRGDFELEILNHGVFLFAIIYGLVSAGISVLTINIIEINLIIALVLGFIIGFLNLILVKIVFKIWNLFKPDNKRREKINWRSYLIFGCIAGLLDILLLFIIFMINDSLWFGAFPVFMRDPIFRSILLPLMAIVIFKVILVDLIRIKWVLKILIIFDIVRIVAFSLPRKRQLIFPETINGDEIKNLLRINLASNNLKNLPELDAFLEYCVYLNDLNLSHNNLDVVPVGILKLKHLQELNLAFNKISNINGNYEFELVSLNLSKNDLTIDQKNNFCLGKYEKLEDLNLSHNTIIKLPSINLESLKAINLSDTRMHLGHKDNLNDFFQNCNNIKEVNLSNNNLEVFPEPLKNYELIKLNLSNTGIRDLSGNLKFRFSLKYLNLSKNSLLQNEQFPDDTITIQGEFNRSITNLVGTDEKLRVFPALEELDLSDNNLTKLPDNLENLKNLKSLLFANNLTSQNITDIPDNINNLTKLPNLETLDLSGNKSLAAYLIVGEEKGFFSNFDELSSVFLKDIGLEEFPTSLINLTKLNLLDLSKNKISLRELVKSQWEFLSQVHILNLHDNELKLDEYDQIWDEIDSQETGYQSYMKYNSANIFSIEESKSFIFNKNVKLVFIKRIIQLLILLAFIGSLLLVLYNAQIIFDRIFEFVIGFFAVLTILFYRKSIRFSGNPSDWRFLNDIIFNVLLLFIVIFLIPPSLTILFPIIGFGLLIMVYDILLESFGYHGKRWKPKGGEILPYLKIPWEMILSFFIIGTAGYFLLSIPEIIGIRDTLGSFLIRLMIAVFGIFWGTNMDWGSPRTIWQPLNKWNVWNTRGIWASGGIFGVAIYYTVNPIITNPKPVCLGSIPCIIDDHLIISTLLVIFFIIMGFIRYYGLDDRGNLEKMFISVIIPPFVVVLIYYYGSGLQDIFFWIIIAFMIIQSLFVSVILYNSKKFFREKKALIQLSCSFGLIFGIFIFGVWLLTL